MSQLDIYLYGEIEPFVFDDWWSTPKPSENSAQKIREKIENAGEIDGINLYINSVGGYVDEGLAIYNILKRQSVPVTAYVDGMACSIASVIAMAAEKVVMPSNTTLMIHNAIGYCCGNAAEHRAYADQLEKISEASTNSYIVHSKGKLTREVLNPLLDAETFLTASEAFKLGLCDEIVDPVDLNENKTEDVIEQAFRAKNPLAKAAASKYVALETYGDSNPNKRAEPAKKQQENPPEKDKFDFFADYFNQKYHYKGV